MDVREPHEVARGKCVGSVCFPLSEMRADEPKPPDALDRSRPIYLHCGRGVRVHPAKELLSGMGFDADKLHPLAEGYDALAIFGRTAGYAVLRSNLDPATPVQPAQPTQPPAAAQQCVPQPQPSSGSGSAPAPSSEQPHLHELARKLAGGEVQLVDVREPHEVARGKCVGSVCFPLSEMRADEPKPPDALDRSRPIYLHCGRGVRVHPAKELLSGMGFDADKLHPLAEGYDALAIFGRTAGYAVLRSNLDPATPVQPAQPTQPPAAAQQCVPQPQPSSGSGSAPAPSSEQPHLHELARKLAGGEVQLVDVREPHEVARGKCVGSVCFPLSEMRADEPKPPDALDRSRPIYLHCGRGVRVHPAKELLSGMGFDADKLHPLAEGYDALAIFGRTAGYAVLRSNLDPATPVQPAQPTQPPAAAPQIVPQPQPSSGSGSAPAPSSEQPHLHELARKLAGGEVQLVDVREPHEVARGKCVGSVCFPLSEMRADEPKPPDALDRSRPIYLHCGRGVRVHPAKELLSGMGFDADKLHPLAEGYDALAIFGRTAGHAVLRSNLDPATPVQPAQPTQPPAAARRSVPQPQPSSGSGSAPAPSSEQPHLHELARKLAGGEVQQDT